MSAGVLVVDAQPLNVKVLEAKLSSEYYEVISATDGASALAAMREEKPDIVLLDIMMPGMDGYDVCRTLKADPATAGIKIVVLTAFAQQATMQQAFAAGADDYMTKPFRPAQLVEKALALLGV